jgi:hypothetical protein
MSRKPDVIALSALPDKLFRETVERLTAGQKPASVARGLMTKHRGSLQHEPLYNIRKYVAELSANLTEQQEQGPADAVTTLESPVYSQASACQVVLSPQDESLRALEDLAANAKRGRGELVLTFVLRKQLERLRRLEREGGKQERVAAVLRQLQRSGEALCKLDEKASRQPWEEFESLDSISHHSQAGPADASIRSAIKAEMDKTSPAVYDKTLTLAKVLGELINLKREEAAEEAAEAAPVPEAGTVVPSAGTTQPPETPDGQS